MRSKKKFLIAMLSLALVAIASVASVVAVLAAQNATATGTFTITYVATPQVVATVSAGKIEGTYGTNVASDASYITLGSALNFHGVEANGDSRSITSSTESLSISALNKFMLLKFSFTNNTTANNQLVVTLDTTSESGATLLNNVSTSTHNLKVFYKTSSSSIAVDSSQDAATGAGTITDFTQATSNWSNLSLTIQKNNTGYIYVAFVVDNFEAGVNLTDLKIKWHMAASSASSV